jgi:hypothetical protein
MSKVSLAVIIIVASVLAGMQQVTFASAQTFGPTKNLSSNSGDSNSEQIAISGSNVFVVWSDNTKGNTDILFKKSSNDGSTFGPTKNLSNNAGNSVLPIIARSSSNIYVLWTDMTAGHAQIFFKKSTDNGNTFGPTKNLSNNDRLSAYPDMVALGSNVYVVWQQSTETDQEIYFKRSSDNGNTFESTVNLSNNDGSSFFPRIASASDFVYVSWIDTPFDEADQGTDIHFKRSINKGQTFGSEVNLSNNPTSYSGRVKMSTAGSNVYVVWDDDLSSTGTSLSYRRSTDNGNSFDTVKQFASKVSLRTFEIGSAGRNVYVVWSQGPEEKEDVYFKKSNNGGSAFAAAKNLSNNEHSSLSPNLSKIGDTVRVVWTDNSSGNSEILYRQSGDAGISFGPAKNLSNNSGKSVFPQIISSSSATFVVWTDDTLGNEDILFSKAAAAATGVTSSKIMDESK